jgi:oligoribonuclease NrnB/cAMP/cGMP phosphodiesterase (DHH superfamily)
MKQYCYYHNDGDGRCAAAIVRLEYPGNISFVPIGNSNISDPNFSKITQDDHVILVDLSIPLEVYNKLRDTTKNITWIDHHKTTMEIMDLIDKEDLDYVFKSGEGGACLLAWNYYRSPVKVPYVVNLISNYDEWKYKYGDKVMLFHIGSSMFDLNPESSIWELLLDPSPKSKRDSKMFADNVCSMGHTILKYQESKVYELLFNCAFNITLEKFKFLAINTDNSNTALRKLDLKKFKIDADGLILFHRQKTKWVVSLYTDKEYVDVSTIAKKYGGGGHKSAAGFATKDLPF